MGKKKITLANEFKARAYEKIFEGRCVEEGELYRVMDQWASVIVKDVDDLYHRKMGRTSLIDVKRTEDEEKKEDIERMISYLMSYPAIVNYFRSLSEMNRSGFVAGIFMIYGWMPRVLRLNCGETLKEGDFIEIRDFLLKLQRCGLPEALDCLDEGGVQSLEKLRHLTNNSVVGMSKLLHFINPIVFPMYDSNLGEIFGGFNDSSSYVEYVKGFNDICLEFASDISKFGRSERVVNLKVKFGYDEKFVLSYVRLVESMLFCLGKNIKRKREEGSKQKKGAKV